MRMNGRMATFRNKKIKKALNFLKAFFIIPVGGFLLYIPPTYSAHVLYTIIVYYIYYNI